MSADPLRVLVAGAGVGGLELALALDELAGDRVALTVVDPAEAYTERAWSPDRVLTPGAHPPVPLATILAPVGATILRDALAAVDTAAHRATLHSGRTLAYDVLVVAVGARNGEVPHGAIAFDPADLSAVRDVATRLASGAIGRMAIVVPPGRHWSLPAYELALILAHHAAGHHRAPDILVVAPEPRPLSIFGSGAPELLREELAAAGVGLCTGTVASVRAADPTTLVLHPGHREVRVDTVVALPALHPHDIGGLDSGGREYLRVDGTGRVEDEADVYAVGDAAKQPLKLGALAAEQADAAARAIATRAGVTVPPRLPRRHDLPALLLTGDGARPLGHATSAVVEPREHAAKVQAPRLARRLESLRA